MKQIAYSLKSVKDGEIPDDGTMSTVLVQRSTTYKGTASLKEDDATVFDVESEEEESPEKSYNRRGKRTLAFSTFDYSPDQLVAYKGGSISAVDGAWEEPNEMPTIERSWQLISKDGNLIEIPRGALRSKFNYEMKQDGVALLENMITILKPEGPGVKALRIVKYELPTVSAGNPVNAAAAASNLVGTAHAFRGDIVSQLWTCTQKPNGAAAPGITTPGALATAITGLVNGVYKFQLAVKDSNDFENTATVTVTVNIA